MKQKQRARDRREAAKPDWNRKPEKKEKPAAVQAKPVVKKPELTAEERARIEEEETRLFLDHVSRTDMRIAKEEPEERKKKAKASPLAEINLEEGMPVAEDAVSRMKQELQVMKLRRIAAVKLIHGYGSSGTGGRIRICVRQELAAMKKRNQIRDFIPGEDFGPFSGAARSLADRSRGISEDRDYGRSNHGITIVIV